MQWGVPTGTVVNRYMSREVGLHMCLDAARPLSNLRRSLEFIISAKFSVSSFPLCGSVIILL